MNTTVYSEKGIHALMARINSRLGHEDKYFVHHESGFYSIRTAKGGGHSVIDGGFKTKTQVFNALHLCENILAQEEYDGNKRIRELEEEIGELESEIEELEREQGPTLIEEFGLK